MLSEDGLVALERELTEEGADVLEVLLDGIGVDLDLHLALEVLLVDEAALPVQLVNLFGCLGEDLFAFQLDQELNVHGHLCRLLGLSQEHRLDDPVQVGFFVLGNGFSDLLYLLLEGVLAHLLQEPAHHFCVLLGNSPHDVLILQNVVHCHIIASHQECQHLVHLLLQRVLSALEVDVNVVDFCAHEVLVDSALVDYGEPNVHVGTWGVQGQWVLLG